MTSDAFSAAMRNSSSALDHDSSSSVSLPAALPTPQPAPVDEESDESPIKEEIVSTQNAEDVSLGLGQIAGLTKSMGKRLGKAVREIDEINLQTRLLSFNAQVEASRAGASGRAFGVVAKEMVDLATRTSTAASKLDLETKTDIRQLASMINDMGTNIRGTRLSDLAFTNIDLIDRNLYERSCDVRWWATDSSCVEALTHPEQAHRASQRLAVILNSYTVYFDIVLCDLTGNIIANGRPEKYQSIGTNHSSSPWFRSAMNTKSGTEFGFEGCHQTTALAGGEMSLVYSSVVRREGQEKGEPLGVLGIVFNWEALAQTIVLRTQIGDSELDFTRVCIVDQTGQVIADNKLKHLRDQISLADKAELIEHRKGYAINLIEDEPHIVAYAHSPGFETYATGWHSFIIQKLDCH